jgi:hypothetical protein
MSECHNGDQEDKCPFIFDENITFIADMIAGVVIAQPNEGNKKKAKNSRHRQILARGLKILLG